MLLCPWGFSRQEHWSGLPCPPPGDLHDPGIELGSLTSPALLGAVFTTSATWETPFTTTHELKIRKKKKSQFHLRMSLNEAVLCYLLSCSVMSNSLQPHGQAPLPTEFPSKEYWSGLPFLTSRDFPDPGIEPESLASPALAWGFFTTSTT